jgi:hypothetical protein
LKHPDNRFNSSALGRYQIVRTGLRTIRKTLGLPGKPRIRHCMTHFTRRNVPITLPSRR